LSACIFGTIKHEQALFKGIVPNLEQSATAIVLSALLKCDLAKNH
jgi:hypothetical protein